MSRRSTSAACLAAAAALGLAACATEPTPNHPAGRDSLDVARALATITQSDFQQQLGALAHDSTLGRLAPSPELAKAASWVEARLNAAGLVTQRQAFIFNTADVVNIVATLPGSDTALAHQAVLVTSHMDHVGTTGHGLGCNASPVLPMDTVCNGADDNASGTVGLILVARAMAALHVRPARTIVFAAFTAEEEGLLGSKWYVNSPTVPLARIAAVFNLDMIARHPPDTVRVAGLALSSLGPLLDSVAAAHAELNLVPADLQGVWAASDHYPFALAGIPAVFFCSGRHADLHTTADNPDRADTEQATRIARLVFLAALKTADDTARPRLVTP